MIRFIMFVVWIVAVLSGIAAFNLLIGVFGIWPAIVTLAVCAGFTILASFRTQAEGKESGRLVVKEWWRVVVNPSWLVRLPHMLSAAYLTALIRASLKLLR